MDHLALLAAIFFLVSVVFAMLGLGGGILYVPILLFAGFSIKAAPAISLILVSATSMAALFTFWRDRKVDWKLALVIDPPTDLMAFAGGYCSALVPEPILLALLAGVLVLAGALMMRSRGPGSVRRERPQRAWWRWRRRFGGREYSVNLPLVLSATALIGVLSGMLGITGGIIKLPIMVLLCGVPMDIAVATSTVMVAVTALSGLAGHALGAPIEWGLGLALALAALAGGLLGSRISLGMDKQRLKRLFALVVWLVALRLVVQLFS